jgi:hypothetical protein
VLATILAALLVTATQAATGDPLTGEWKVRNDVAGNVSEMTCSMSQKGEELTGSCVTEQGKVEITGKVVETSVTWVFRSTYNGGPITLNYKGSLKDGQVAGEVTVEEFSVTGEFSAAPIVPPAK